MTPTKTDISKLKEWQRETESTYACFSGSGLYGSLVTTGRGIFIVRENGEIVYKGVDAKSALAQYAKTHEKSRIAKAVEVALR